MVEGVELCQQILYNSPALGFFESPIKRFPTIFWVTLASYFYIFFNIHSGIKLLPAIVSFMGFLVPLVAYTTYPLEHDRFDAQVAHAITQIRYAVGDPPEGLRPTISRYELLSHLQYLNEQPSLEHPPVCLDAE